jgi:hypothetical protein
LQQYLGGRESQFVTARRLRLRGLAEQALRRAAVIAGGAQADYLGVDARLTGGGGRCLRVVCAAL